MKYKLKGHYGGKLIEAKIEEVDLKQLDSIVLWGNGLCFALGLAGGFLAGLLVSFSYNYWS